jgi:hypothetical protein
MPHLYRCDCATDCIPPNGSERILALVDGIDDLTVAVATS